MKTKKRGMDQNRVIAVADCETDPFDIGVIPEPFIWGYYEGYGDGYYREFTDTAEFAAFIATRDVYLYAHNGGKFDWHFLTDYFEPGGDLLVIGGRLARFDIGSATLLDSFNLIPIALAKFEKTKIDYRKFHKSVRHKYMDEIRSYLKDDCVNLWNMIQEFKQDYGLHITQASAAMSYWQKKMKQYVPRSSEEFFDKFRRFYYGGRVQCFQSGDLRGDYKMYDINSAYPYAMLDEHPYSLEYVQRTGEPRRSFNQWGPMFFTVEGIARGCFPYRATDKSLYYPEDDERRIYHVTGWELIAAIETGTLEDFTVLEHYQFEDTKNFREYIMHFWELRKRLKEEKSAAEVFAKLMMNSLYGKFGQDIRRNKNYTLRNRDELDEIISDMQEGDLIYDFHEWLIEAKTMPLENRKFFNIATAASITGFVRAYLWRAISSSDDVVYCDTDSITAVDFGRNIILGDELGQWGIDGEFDRVVVCGKKLYAMHKAGTVENDSVNWKVASKGARLTHENIIDVAKGLMVEYESDVPTYSVTKKEPMLLSRKIRGTAKDITTVPREIDPKYVYNLGRDENGD